MTAAADPVAPPDKPARRIPIVATLVVLAAVVGMVMLGLWQVRRMDEKAALLAHYAAAPGQPSVAWPVVPLRDGALLYRRSGGMCVEPTTWSARAGRNLAGESGWRHIVLCRTGAEGPGMAVDMGWSRDPKNPVGWTGGRVTGTIDADRDHVLLLVSDAAAPGLVPSLRPSPADIPNNHFAYAVQWFAFAAIALVIYAIALRRRG
ncbi:SURF1 family cytochrome oxidase biogenesis protein [Sphingomonas montana]|uniref:SURF1 family cytochrome oxidase biogenesis protein n=1 Tax=Sphingomonas montana TaxID=1843236 RepID=UPI001F0AC321|nr:SURF1 family cytochrome oxidase biogenesis protein [Sphingomonas montana]